jgi:hypothetical protein
MLSKLLGLIALLIVAAAGYLIPQPGDPVAWDALSLRLWTVYWPLMTIC